MPELRWLIGLLGLAVLFAAFLYWRRVNASDPDLGRNTRREPVLSDTPGGSGAYAGKDPVASEADDSQPEPAIAEEPLPELIVTLRLMSRDRRGFVAEQIVLAMRKLGLKHGKYGIFHAHSEQEEILFSIANLVEPGTFDLTQLKTQRYPGISLFLVLPGPEDPLDAFDSMISVGKALALEFSGDLLDEQGGILSAPRERFLREEIISSQRLQF